MNRAAVVAGFLLAAAPAAQAQVTETQTIVAAPVMVTGEVVRYEPNKILVIRTAGGKETTYNVAAGLSMPAGVQVGRTVNVFTARPGDANVTRVTTTTVTSDGQVKKTTEETQVDSTGAVRKTTTTEITGEVVRYTPGRTVVVKRTDGTESTFSLAPTTVVPADVQVGKQITLHTEPGLNGNTTVSRILTTSVTPEGQMKRTVEETRRDASGATTKKTTTVTIQGTVEEYIPGKSVTVLRSDGSRATYIVGSEAKLPAAITIGQAVRINDVPVVETIILPKE